MLLVETCREAEIGQLDVPILVYQNIVRFDVPGLLLGLDFAWLGRNITYG